MNEKYIFQEQHPKVFGSITVILDYRKKGTVEKISGFCNKILTNINFSSDCIDSRNHFINH